MCDCQSHTLMHAPVAVKLTVKLPAMQDCFVRASCLSLLDIQSLDPRSTACTGSLHMLATHAPSIAPTEACGHTHTFPLQHPAFNVCVWQRPFFLLRSNRGCLIL